MENEDPIAVGEDLARLEDGEPGAADEPEVFELELDGEVYTLPAALKGCVLRQADYTRKTQELAEHRRALEAEREAVIGEARAQRGMGGDRLRLAAIDHQLDEFQGVDWQAFGAGDPEGARVAWSAFQRLGGARERLAYAVAHHDERESLRAAREAAQAMAETGRTLSREIDGWSPEVAAKLVDYAQAFGVTLEELAEAADPRLWKLLHKAWRADQANQGDAAAEARALRPAVVVSGGGAGGGGPRAELGTKEWMRRRNEQVSRGR